MDKLLDQLIAPKLRWWQKLRLCTFGYVLFLASTQHFSMVFYAPKINHWCAPPASLSDVDSDVWRKFSIPPNKETKSQYSQCEEYDLDYLNVTSKNYMEFMEKHNRTLSTKKCAAWSYSDSWKRTVVEELDLVCDRSTLVSVSSSIYMAGMLTGAFVLSQMSDRFGRKPTYILALFMWVISSFACAFSINMIMFCIFRFSVAISTIGCITITSVMSQEALKSQQRAKYNIYFQALFPVGLLVNTGIIYFLRHWKIDQIIFSGGVIILIFVELIGPESPKWLISIGRYHEAVRVMKYIAKKHGVEVPNEQTIFEMIENEAARRKESAKVASFFDLFKTPVLRKRILISYVIWFSVTFSYFGFTLNTNNLAGDFFLNLTISSSLEIVFTLLTALFMVKLGRRLSTIVLLISAGVLLLISIPVPDHIIWIKVGAPLISRSFVGMLFCIVYVYTSELMPTVLRSIGVGSSSSIARIGGIISPYCNEIQILTEPYVPLIIYGVLCIIAGLSAIELPETMNVPIVNSIEEIENQKLVIDTELQDKNNKNI